jgi:hypothetical protein
MSYYKTKDYISRCNQTNTNLQHVNNTQSYNTSENFEIYIKNPVSTENSSNLTMTSELNNLNSRDPKVWGPSFWFTLHNGAINYPLKGNKICKDRMKKFIQSMEVMIPCEKCSDHATSYISSNFSRLDEIVSTRDNLFKFFVDFHNQINIRYGKPLFSYEEAYKLYSNSISLKMSYN